MANNSIEELKLQLQQEIKNTVEMERLAKENLQLFNQEHEKLKRHKDFIEYLKEICTLRMTFENPNNDLKTCLNFIDTTFDDILIRIKDIEKLNNN